MTSSSEETTAVQEIAEEAVEHDRELADEAKSIKRRADDAKHRHGQIIAELNQWRWEMTECPYGPRYSQHAYAKAVGQNQSTISRGVTAWQAHLDASDSMQDASGCSLGGEPHDVDELPGPLTDEVVENHDKARRKLEAGDIKAIVIERLARYWDVVPTTIEVNYRALVNDAVARLNAENDLKTMNPEQITRAADEIAGEMRLEANLREAHERAVQKWMTTNRAAEQPVASGEVRKMVDRIERRMESREWTWEQAEADTRKWDYARCEVERSNNVFTKQARLAVLDLMQAAAGIHSAAIKLGRALQKIETDEIPIADEEMDMVRLQIANAAGIVAQAQAAVSGSSNTDWDAALAALDGGAA